MAHWLKYSILLVVLITAGVQARILHPQDLDVDDSQLETKGLLAIEPRADDNSEGNYRLPNNTEPVSYNVELWTQVDTGVRPFTGRVKIDLRVINATNTITLHARQTDKYSASIVSRDNAGSAAIPLNVTVGTRDFLHLTPTDGTSSFGDDTNWTLTIDYSGELRRDQAGFYLSSYTDDDGKVHYLATTQFESTNARHAFPCYDEPARRATFTITLNHNPSYTAICNMPVNEAESSPGKTVFLTTPRMSTYLIAFIVSDFESTSGELNGLPQRVFSRKGRQDQQEWTLWSGLVVESSLAKYFGVPFALPKLDQAGIPDFSAGAMENWGLATYREQYMWWTKEKSTINLKTNIANIIGHEYAHMWFGDLVCLKWWTYLWLKEGFATLFSYESNDIAFPEWNTYQIFHLSDYNNALINDAALTAVPMTHYVQTPNEISARYNTFSYAKPASVLYMFKNAYTDAVFRLGLNKYLNKHKFQATDEWDLFASLQDAADELGHKLPTTVANIFSSWSHQAGYPLLTVVRNYEAGTFSVKQQRFLNNKDTVNDATWYVPINYAVASSYDYRDTSASHYLLNVKETTVTDVKLASGEWFLLNKQSSGYYRILYDEQNYHLIAKGLAEETYKFHPRNRAQLMQDAYRFVDTGRLSQGTLLELMSYLKHEDQYAPWSAANSILTTFDTYLRGDDHYHHFQEFVVEQVEDIFNNLGVNEIPGEHYLNNYLRVVLLSLACQMGSDSCHKRAHEKLHNFLQNGIPLEPTVRTQSMCSGLIQSEDATFNEILDQVLTAKSPTDTNLYIMSLGCSRNAAQLKRFLESSIDKTNSLRDSERTSLLTATYSKSEAGLTACLEFLESNWKPYAQLGTGTAKPLDTALRGMARSVVSEKQKTRLNALVTEVNTNGPEYVNDNLSTVVDNSIQANFDWLNVHRDPMMNWLSAYYSKSDGDNGSASLAASLFTILAMLIAFII